MTYKRNHGRYMIIFLSFVNEPFSSMVFFVFIVELNKNWNMNRPKVVFMDKQGIFL